MILVIGYYLILECDFVDGNGVFASVVLEYSGEEGLSEEEPTQPEVIGRVVIYPVLEELNPVP